jgi:hypothetical protein
VGNNRKAAKTADELIIERMIRTVEKNNRKRLGLKQKGYNHKAEQLADEYGIAIPTSSSAYSTRQAISLETP